MSEIEKTETKTNIFLYDLVMEQMLLGSIFYTNINLEPVLEILKPYHFYQPLHQRIFAKMVEFDEKGLVITVETMSLFIQQDQAFSENPLDGSNYLAKLLANSVLVINVKQISKVIAEYWIIRNIYKIHEEAISSIKNIKDTEEIVNSINLTEEKIYKLMENRLTNIYNPKQITPNIVKRVEDLMQLEDGTTGIPTGFIDIDSILDGLHKSDLVIIAARPSMGKTALAINIAVNIAKNIVKDNKDESVAFVSLEMSAEQLMLRIIAMESRINIQQIRKGNVTRAQLEDINKVIDQTINKLPLIIQDSSILTITELRSDLRKMKRKNNISCAFVDYLQLLKSEVSENRTQQITEITQGLKAIAKELNIPIVALSQLSREVEKRDDKIPQLSDLRESGSIEQDADVVLFIFREAYYLERQKPDVCSQQFSKWLEKMDNISNEVDVIVAKHRNGPIGFKKLFFDRNTTIFGNYKKY